MLGRVGQQGREGIEAVSGTLRPGDHIAAVVGIDRRFQRHPAGDLDAGAGKAVELGRIVGKQHDPCAVQHLQHACG